MKQPVKDHDEGEGNGLRGRRRPQLRDFLLSELLLGAIVLTAVTTVVSIFVTKAIEPDTEAVFDEYQLAQGAREGFTEGLASLAKTKAGERTQIYQLLISQKPEIEMQFENHEWRRADEGYDRLSREITDICYSEEVSLPGVCKAATPIANPPPPPLEPIPPNAPTRQERETPRHSVDTFSDYMGPAGEGPIIAAGRRVRVSCKVYDPSIASVDPDGYWYRIATSPWSNRYYAPANTFLNGDPPYGPYRHNTNFAVPNCKYKRLSR
jgi:hypothetical protein